MCIKVRKLGLYKLESHLCQAQVNLKWHLIFELVKTKNIVYLWSKSLVYIFVLWLRPNSDLPDPHLTFTWPGPLPELDICYKILDFSQQHMFNIKLLCICEYVSEGVRESGKHLGCIIQCLYPFFYPQFMGELTELSNLYHTGTGGRVIISLLGH